MMAVSLWAKERKRQSAEGGEDRGIRGVIKRQWRGTWRRGERSCAGLKDSGKHADQRAKIDKYKSIRVCEINGLKQRTKHILIELGGNFITFTVPHQHVWHQHMTSDIKVNLCWSYFKNHLHWGLKNKQQTDKQNGLNLD